MRPMRNAPTLAFMVICAAVPLAQAGPAASANPALWPAAASPPQLTDAATEKAISDLLGRMTVEQKVGQLIQADISAIAPADLLRYPLGSLLAGGNSGPYGNERADAATWRRMVAEYREVSRKSGAGIPILFGVDAVHGHSNLPGATIFPHNIGLGATGDTQLIRRIGQATAAEIASSGIEWTFAPTLAVPQDVRWGRSYEGYTSDPARVAAYGRAMTEGLQGRLRSGRPLGPLQVAATAKHYLADGGTADGRDQGDANIGEAELIERHAPGYPAAIDAGVLTVMASFSSWQGAKHHGNASLLTDVLKGRMGFTGLVVGDWNGHGQVAGCTATHCPAAINAGLDLFMAPDSWRGLYDSTVNDVREGRIPQVRVDDAVRRVLRVKYKLGLMGPQLVERGVLPDTTGAPAHLALAREAVAKSLVLLKNEGNVLPVRPGTRTLIAGSGADSMAMQAGGWTVTWQGTDTSAADFPNGQTIGRALADAIREAGGEAKLASDGHDTTRPDLAIVVTGEQPYAEFQGDLSHLAFPTPPADRALVERLRREGIRVVVVFLSGRPLFVGNLMNQADAFVAAWLPGTQGRGVADVLVAGRGGKSARGFQGRLPFAWPDDARSPVKAPLFPVGYGLDYRSAGASVRFNEDPRLDLSALDNSRTFFRRGMPPAPWYLATNGMVQARAVDVSAQEDARRFSWGGTGRLSVEGPLVDLSSQLAAGADLLLDWRIDAAPGSAVRLALGGMTVDMTSTLAAVAKGAMIETRVPLRCFAAAGANLSQVGNPLVIEADQGFVMTIRNAYVTAGAGASACPGAGR
jgi:beta-glucosidase